ncbi:amiloride-sensitive sodium channel subunit delta isoform X2 [Erinaceus europaeus]|uniref:Amiloride-sensitive sodium channel subunit delta isoform X2 n=1 Tax=Erinaceus europaeus TaxID=9365 RepID=A0ABM3Y434_ERIEU|nr:amiloride-sensitive sodium channel subunit delta isoform X2 [Erinaceus europaeus]
MEVAVQGTCSPKEAGLGLGAGPPPLEEEEQHSEGLVELHASFQELFTFFCTNTTMHGAIRLVCSRRNRLKTTCWVLLFLGALGTLYWQFGVLFQQYWRYPVIMTMALRSQPRRSPSVTLCDMNPQRPAPVHHHLQALDEFAQENIRSLYTASVSVSQGVAAPSCLPGLEPGVPVDRRIRLLRLSHLGAPNRVGFRLCNSTGGDCFYRASASGWTAAREWYRLHYLSVLAQLPPTQQDPQNSRFIVSCHYDGQDCQAGPFQVSHHPIYGTCYTFSGILSTQQPPAVAHGLSLVLRTEQQKHLPLLATKAGAKVTVHQQDHSPFLEHHGFSVRPGTETSISIREACLVSCFQQLMVNRCSCGYYFYPLPAGAEYCSYSQHQGWDHCFFHLYRTPETHHHCAQHCPRPCRESIYKLSAAGTSRWPSSKSSNWIQAVLGEQHPSQDPKPRIGLAKVNIIYQELNYRIVDETPVYTIPQLLSAMGNLWGLWFGSSVLSVVELLELLLDAMALGLLLGCRRLHQLQDPSQGQPQGWPNHVRGVPASTLTILPGLRWPLQTPDNPT